MLDLYLLKLSYQGESFRVKLRVEKFRTLGDLEKIVYAAWPYLDKSKYKIVLPDGGTIDDASAKMRVATKLSGDAKDPSGHLPELKLKVVPLKEVAPMVHQPKKLGELRAIDGHDLAVTYWESCDGCQMFPLVGKWYICYTCGQEDLCFACRQGHSKSHKVIQYSPSSNGMWDNDNVVENEHKRVFKLKVLGAPCPKPKDFEEIQKRQASLPPMVTRTFALDEIPDGIPDVACYRDGGKAIYFEMFCHGCGTGAQVAKRFKMDGRDDINLCETCYLLYKDSVLSSAYKCCRVWQPGRVGRGDDGKPFLATHYSTTCSECEESPIVGRRYTCLVCSNFDLCSECYRSRAQTSHRQAHAFGLVAKPVPLWSLKIAKPRGVRVEEFKCSRCGSHPDGGAKYRMKFGPPDSRDALYCEPCYKKMLQREALELRAPMDARRRSITPWSHSARARSRTLILGLKGSLAFRLNARPRMIELIRQIARETGQLLDIDSDDSDSLEWAVEPPKELKSDDIIDQGPNR